MQDYLNDTSAATVPNQFIKSFSNGTELWIKREDLLHPEVSGNKFRKLKYNIMEAHKQHLNSLLTYGGAFSNHIAATAAAGKLFSFKTIGVIRGEELSNSRSNWSPTLKFAESCGMQFHFISREEYRKKDSEENKRMLEELFGDFYRLPEGGTNGLAIKGCEEILQEKDARFDYICASVGTGGTLAGIINSSKENQEILGFSALKDDYLQDEIQKLAKKPNWKLIKNYHFGGYAKITSELIEFMNNFNKKYKIILDPVYTGKLVFGIFDLINQGFFTEKSKILAVHTGGLQGIEGMNLMLKKKKLPLINV